MGWTHYSGEATILPAMQERKPWCSSHRDDNKIFQDAVIVKDSVALWAYHGNIIASFDGEEWKKSTAGWNTSTTRARLNSIPGRGIRVKNFEPLNLDGSPWKDDILPVLYHRIDGWRGYSFPALAAVGASDTGNWSDSPCRPEEELKNIASFLLEHGVKTYPCWTETSNVFCIKRWLQVKPDRLSSALSLVEGYLASHETRLLHLPE